MQERRPLIDVRLISDQAAAVIAAPAAFYRTTMPRTGGFKGPLVFMIVLTLVGSFLFALGFALSVNPVAGLIMAAASVLLVPLVVSILSFLMSALLFLVWRALGSKQSFETSYRVFAYTYSIFPITTVLGFLPYLGLVGMGWNFVLLAIASVEVHRIPARVAYPVFGLITLLLAVLAVNAQPQLRALQQQIDHLQTAAPARSHPAPAPHPAPARP